MASFEKLKIQKLMIFDKLKNVDCRENMSRQKLKNTLETPSIPKFPLRPKTSASATAPRSASRSKMYTPASTPRPEKPFSISNECKPKVITGVFYDR